MQQFIHSCYFTISSYRMHLGNKQVILCTLITVLAILVTVQNGLHAIPNMHMPLLGDASDPWNG